MMLTFFPNIGIYDAPDKSPFRGNRPPETKAILKPVSPKSDFCRARHLSISIEDEAVRHLRSLKEPTEELARQASAIIDQGQLDKFNKVQLWFRLAEFEAAIQVANDILINNKNKKK